LHPEKESKTGLEWKSGAGFYSRKGNFKEFTVIVKASAAMSLSDEFAALRAVKKSVKAFFSEPLAMCIQFYNLPPISELVKLFTLSPD
jgi:hypothetical protein